MSRRNLPLYALSLFEAAARHQSFTRAADELCLTQGAVSKQMAQLEAHLGYPLFHRYARSLKLSVQGECLLGYVQQALGLLDKGVAEAAAASAPLRLKAPSCIARWLLQQLRAFADEAPEISVQLSGVHAHDIDFARENYDLAIVYRPLASAGERGVVLFAERLTPVLAPSLLAQVGRKLDSPAALAAYPLLHPSADRRDWRQWLQANGERQPALMAGTVFDTLDQAMNAALQGFGVTLGDVTLLAEELKSGQAIAPFASRLDSGYGYVLLLPEQAPAAAALRLQQWFQQRIAPVA